MSASWTWCASCSSGARRWTRSPRRSPDPCAIGSAAGTPDDQGLGPAGAARGALPGTRGNDITSAARREDAGTGAEHATGPLELGGELTDAGLQRRHLVLEVQDALDAGQADALVLGEPLHLAQPRHVPGGVATAAPAGARGGDEAEPVVLAQRLRVHAGELGCHGDDEHGVLLTRGEARGGAHGTHGAHPLRARSNRSARGSAPASSSRNVSTALRAASESRC